MSEIVTYPVSTAAAEHALINNDKYLELYERSVSDPESFWADMGKRIDWIKPYTQIKDVSYANSKLRNHKSLGSCNISAEVFKVLKCDSLCKCLASMFNIFLV